MEAGYLRFTVIGYGYAQKLDAQAAVHPFSGIAEFPLIAFRNSLGSLLTSLSQISGRAEWVAITPCG